MILDEQVITARRMKMNEIRVALQVAVAGLKAAPIPDLDRIPGDLLLLIETYEVSDPAILPDVLSDSIDSTPKYLVRG